MLEAPLPIFGPADKKGPTNNSMPSNPSEAYNARPDSSTDFNQAPSRSFGITLIKVALILVGLCGVTLAAYLSLRRSSWLGSIHWIPRWLARWSDHHGNIRNFPAFFAMALPFLFALRCARIRIWTMLALGAVAALLELSQRFIPTRSASLDDVFASWAGLLVAWALVEGIRFCATWLRRKLRTQDNAD